MKLAYTRAMITAALNGDLNKVNYQTHPVFGLKMPVSCPNVPHDVLNPVNTWDDKTSYEVKAYDLADEFNKNFKKFEDKANQTILDSAPKSKVLVD